MKKKYKIITTFLIISLLANGIFITNIITFRKNEVREQRIFLSKVNALIYISVLQIDNIVNEDYKNDEFNDLKSSLNRLTIDLYRLDERINTIQPNNMSIYMGEFNQISSRIQSGCPLTETVEGSNNLEVTVKLLGYGPSFGESGELTEGESKFLEILKEDLMVLQKSMLGSEGLNVRDDATIDEFLLGLEKFTDTWGHKSGYDHSPLSKENPYDVLE